MTMVMHLMVDIQMHMETEHDCVQLCVDEYLPPAKQSHVVHPTTVDEPQEPDANATAA